MDSRGRDLRVVTALVNTRVIGGSWEGLRGEGVGGGGFYCRPKLRPRLAEIFRFTKRSKSSVGERARHIRQVLDSPLRWLYVGFQQVC